MLNIQVSSSSNYFNLCCNFSILRTSAANRRASKNGKRSNKDSSLGFDIQVGNAIPFSEKL